ncbi:MAG TPA: diacylglycerol kinase family protein [Propionibacteriaceae bacterium]|nr:diacylglycerol kinase family protein [Propionibacteriaceae bacterium]
MADQTARRSAVVFNPVKVDDDFRDTVSRRLTEAGWSEPMWLETAEDDPGRSMTATAREAEVDLVLAAGGDGTVRVVADGLAGSKITMAILPSGTANLLALNLGIPNPLDQALDIALAGHTKTIDLIKITVDGDGGEHYAVMAGVGVDAMIMDETRPELKDKIGSAAYFVAAAKALGRLPIPMQIKVDDHRAHRRRAMICLIGNVSQLPGNISVIPDAAPDDGLLDVYVASPHRISHWLRVFLRLITRRRHGDDTVDQWRGRRVEVRLKTPDNYQLDGDVVGEMRTLVAEVQPGALTICVPSEQ